MELEFHGKVDFDKANVSITNITGNEIDNFDWYGNSKTLNLTNLSKGFYFIKIKLTTSLKYAKLLLSKINILH